jgi:hypothetical protein
MAALKQAGLDPRAVGEGSADEMQASLKLREIWDSAPVRQDLQGTKVRLPGYVVPLEYSQGAIREFLLVPYFGACIHSPPPPANQIVLVRLDKPARLQTMDVVSGLVKASVFGFVIALMGCWCGYNSRGGAQGVGAAATSAVVISSILILALDYIITEMFFAR